MDAYRPRKTQYEKTLEMIAGIKDREAQEHASETASESKSLFESAKFSQNAAVAKRLEAKRKAVLESQYDGRVAKIGLEIALSEAAIRALPLDEEEYKKINPKYSDEISKSITEAMDGQIDVDGISAPIKVILKGISEAAPAKSEGMLMEDQTLRDKLMTSLQDNEDVDNAIDSLSATVRDNVAGIVANDQRAADQINSAIEDIKTAKDIAAEKMGADQSAAAQAAQTADQQAQSQQAEAAADDPATYDPNYIPDPSAEAAPAAAAPEMGKDVSITVGGTTVTVHNESYSRNAPVKGIVEALALQESINMISNGQRYDSDLALANAIKTITVLETMNASGLVRVGRSGYARLLESISRVTACKPSKAKRLFKECDGDGCQGIKTANDIAAENSGSGKVAGFPDEYFVTKTYKRGSNGYDKPSDPSRYVDDGGAPKVSTEAK